jgi:predicted RNase H-like HicB family nuclease
MFEDYLNAGMHLAQYELLEGDEGFFGSIPGAQGVWANEDTLEKCRDVLREVLEEWVLLGISLHHELPDFGGVKLELSYQKTLDQVA